MYNFYMDRELFFKPLILDTCKFKEISTLKFLYSYLRDNSKSLSLDETYE